MKRRKDKTGRSVGKLAPFVALERYLLQSSAWRDLSSNARAAYVEVASGYDGKNNGRIVVATQSLGVRMGCDKSTAARALKELSDHGFVECQKKGGFVCKIRHASEWRLTAFKCDVTGGLPLRPFMSWQPKKQNTAAWAQPNGGAGATMEAKKAQKAAPRWHGRNREGGFEVPLGGTGATLLYSSHRPAHSAASDGAAHPMASASRDTSNSNPAADTFKTIASVVDGITLKNLRQLDVELSPELKSWEPLITKKDLPHAA